jgi:hypothetical protein
VLMLLRVIRRRLVIGHLGRVLRRVRMSAVILHRNWPLGCRVEIHCVGLCMPYATPTMRDQYGCC